MPFNTAASAWSAASGPQAVIFDNPLHPSMELCLEWCTVHVRSAGPGQVFLVAPAACVFVKRPGDALVYQERAAARAWSTSPPSSWWPTSAGRNCFLKSMPK
jgi:hypothetical protein